MTYAARQPRLTLSAPALVALCGLMLVGCARQAREPAATPRHIAAAQSITTLASAHPLAISRRLGDAASTLLAAAARDRAHWLASLPTEEKRRLLQDLTAFDVTVTDYITVRPAARDGTAAAGWVFVSDEAPQVSVTQSKPASSTQSLKVRVVYAHLKSPNQKEFILGYTWTAADGRGLSLSWLTTGSAWGWTSAHRLVARPTPTPDSASADRDPPEPGTASTRRSGNAVLPLPCTQGRGQG